MACYANSTLFYGIFVGVAEIYMAADAWESLEPALTSIEMIRSRKSRGILVIEEGKGLVTNVTNVPIEVWGQIRKELIKVELENAEKEMLESLAGFSINHDDQVNRVWSSWSEAITYDYVKEALDDNGGVRNMLHERKDTINGVLERYGLTRVDQGLYHRFEDDPRPLIAISIPLPLDSKSGLPICTAIADSDSFSGSNQLLSFDLEIFQIVSKEGDKIRRSFNRLVKDFHLQAFDPSQLTLNPVNSKVKAVDTGNEVVVETESEKEAEEKIEREEASKPQWRVWASSEVVE
ncbi:hypothetical protein JCM5353_004014 [Sporobolomyces roseus]